MTSFIGRPSACHLAAGHGLDAADAGAQVLVLADRAPIAGADAGQAVAVDLPEPLDLGDLEVAIGRKLAALPFQPDGEIARKTSLKTPYCNLNASGL